MRQWMSAAYSDLILVTWIGGLHADHAKADEHLHGIPTSSSPLPGLVVRMHRRARLYAGFLRVHRGNLAAHRSTMAARIRAGVLWG